MEEGRSAFRILTREPTKKRPLEMPRCRWEDNIRIDLEEITEVKREWRRLYDEELSSFYRSPNMVMSIKSRKLSWAGDVVRIEEGRSASKIITGKPTEKRPLARPKPRWKDNIRNDLKEIGLIRGIGFIGIIGMPL